jgi:hypothetical protein
MKHPDNKFIHLFYFYIFIYTILLIFGYSSLSNVINNKTIQIVNFKENTPNFILKRFLQLSLITLLFSSITVLNLNINTYIISVILNIVVIIGYGIYFDKNDFITYFIHIIMAIPIFLLPFYTFFSGIIYYYYILLFIVFLLIYKLHLFDYAYTYKLLNITHLD